MRAPNVADLAKAIVPARRLVVFLHDHPDPDCLASGLILQGIAAHIGVRSVIVHGGMLGRAENRAMASLLHIPLRPLEVHRLRFLSTDRFALVDTQPGTGNNAFPADRLPCHIVFDHHPPRPGIEADFVDIRTGEGCTTTLLLGYHREMGIALDPLTATAAAYAIMTETQDLEREATRGDREALQHVLPAVQLTTLGRIRHPVRPREYFRAIARAMQDVQISSYTCVCHMGSVQVREIVAEMADFLVAMERVTFCLVTGHSDGRMVLSIRTRAPSPSAERVVRKMLAWLGRGGGHERMAGGTVECEDLDHYLPLTDILTERFLAALPPRARGKLHPLVGK